MIHTYTTRVFVCINIFTIVVNCYLAIGNRGHDLSQITQPNGVLVHENMLMRNTIGCVSYVTGKETLGCLSTSSMSRINNHSLKTTPSTFSKRIIPRI